jgi:DNA-binding MurR/RpiR family transcriptional regulator
MDRVRARTEAVGSSGGSAQTFAALKTDINAKYAGLSRQLKSIARFVLDHPNSVALETTATLARRAGVQPSALVRFAQALGYDGFSAMQQVFRSRLVLQFDSMRDRIETLGTVHVNASDNGKASIIDDAVNEAQASLERLRIGIDERTLQRAGNVLTKAGHIYVLGQGKSFPVAFYLHFALLRLQRPCTLLSGTGGSIAQEASLIGRQDALVTVSFRPYTPQVIDIARDRHGHGVPVIAITDSSLSPLWPVAAAAFEVVDQDRQVYQSMVAPLCMAQILAISLGHRLMQDEAARR